MSSVADTIYRFLAGVFKAPAGEDVHIDTVDAGGEIYSDKPHRFPQKIRGATSFEAALTGEAGVISNTTVTAGTNYAYGSAKDFWYDIPLQSFHGGTLAEEDGHYTVANTAKAYAQIDFGPLIAADVAAVWSIVDLEFSFTATDSANSPVVQVAIVRNSITLGYGTGSHWRHGVFTGPASPTYSETDALLTDVAHNATGTPNTELTLPHAVDLGTYKYFIELYNSSCLEGVRFYKVRAKLRKTRIE